MILLQYVRTHSFSRPFSLFHELARPRRAVHCGAATARRRGRCDVQRGATAWCAAGGARYQPGANTRAHGYVQFVATAQWRIHVLNLHIIQKRVGGWLLYCTVCLHHSPSGPSLLLLILLGETNRLEPQLLFGLCPSIYSLRTPQGK